MWLYLYDEENWIEPDGLLVNTSLLNQISGIETYEDEKGHTTYWLITLSIIGYDSTEDEDSCVETFDLYFKTEEKRDRYYKALLAKLNPEHLLLDD